jgi:uncharacterized protein YabN with tetrapyrrole methylase and pyrophosphatase domain
MKKQRKPRPAIEDLLGVMARLRAPHGCPWDREQDHRSIRFHAIEEVYELLDAIEAGDDSEMAEELGDLLLQVVFHCQLANERHAFDFEQVTRHLVNKLVRRHPHVFSGVQVRSVAGVWAQWDRIKQDEKHGPQHARPSALDGIPKHLPALLKAEKLLKKAQKAGLIQPPAHLPLAPKPTKNGLGKHLLALVHWARQRGWSAEELLRAEVKRAERTWRRQERTAKAGR